ncbi:MAG: GNAT family N-acetyltransferase [Clostridium sp.]|nr:GNAT family N-acetyltransferase [Clostridium sp.]
MYNNTSALKKIINQHITLETDRLKIRPLSLKELIGINIKKYDNLRTEIEKEALITSTKNAIAKKIVKMENINERLHVWYTYWLIIDKETDKGIGFIGFKGIPDEKGYVEVGYSISPSHRRKGLMTEALRAMEKWTCSKKDCKGIIAYALKSNLGSHKVLINCGFKDSSADEYIRAYILKF